MDKTPESPADRLFASINRDAGVVGLAPLLDYLESRRRNLQEHVMRSDNTDRQNDMSRGRHAMAGDLLTILNRKEPDPS